MNLSLLAPELILSVAGLVLMFSDTGRPRRKTAGLLASVAVIVALVAAFRIVPSDELVLGMAVSDSLARYLKVVLLVGVLLVIGMSLAYREFRSTAEGDEAGPAEEIGWGTYFALLLFSAVGLLLLVSAVDFILIVVAFELISITSFVLTGFLKQKRSAEAAMKFFLVGAFSSGLMIYGISLIYGLVGSTSLSALVAADPLSLPRLPLVGAMLFILAGFGFKVALAPFHMWVPDAYEGAPTPITGFISVAPKAAAFGALLRVLPNHGELDMSLMLAMLAALSMTLGNLSAIRQSNVKRLLAYSSIAQMGYVLIGFVASGSIGFSSVLIYILAYVVMNLGAFACAIAVSNQTGSELVDGFSGLARRSLPLALTTTVFLLSLTGIPPLVGFIGKFSVFAAAVSEGWVWLAVVGVINSVVSLYYYFSIVHRMFFSEPSRPGPVSLTPSLAASVLVAFVITLWVGLFPNVLFAWAQGAVR